MTHALELPRDPFLDYAIRQAARALQPRWQPELVANRLPSSLGEPQLQYLRALAGPPTETRHPGLATYELACLPCHQPEGRGLTGLYPPLANSEWVRGNPDDLIRIVLHGLTGPIQVAGAEYGGPDAIPMPGLAGMADQDIADVLTYIRQAFGSGAPAVPVEAVSRIRTATAARTDPWTAVELGLRTRP